MDCVFERVFQELFGTEGVQVMRPTEAATNDEKISHLSLGGAGDRRKNEPERIVVIFDIESTERDNDIDLF